MRKSYVSVRVSTTRTNQNAKDSSVHSASG
jgi:hypothetical protein